MIHSEAEILHELETNQSQRIVQQESAKTKRRESFNVAIERLKAHRHIIKHTGCSSKEAQEVVKAWHGKSLDTLKRLVSMDYSVSTLKTLGSLGCVRIPKGEI